MMSYGRLSIEIPPGLERELLARLEANARPAGCGSVWADLQAIGFTKSPTTVGRILRQLDLRGYTRRVSYRGRSLTEAGSRRLAELREAHNHADSHSLLLESVRPSTIGELLDLLVARRAIEREIARLAALRATEQQIQTLWAAVADQEAAVRERTVAVEEDRRFHEALAETSGNRVLAVTLRFIRRSLVMLRLQEEIRRGRASGLVVDHRAVVEAVARHDPVAAEAAMLRHLDHIIDDIVRYCQVHPDGFGAHMVPMVNVVAPAGVLDRDATTQAGEEKRS